MLKMDRRKLILIIAIGVTVILASVAIVLSMLTGSKPVENDNTPVPVPTPTEENPYDELTGVEEGAPVLPSDGEEPPSKTLYENDYSQDVGYTRLPETFDKNTNAIEDTIYDDSYVYLTYNMLMCELSNKNTVTERALQPIRDFQLDLVFNGSSLASNYNSEINYNLAKLDKLIGQRLPGDVKSEYEMIYCNAGEVESEYHED